MRRGRTLYPDRYGADWIKAGSLDTPLDTEEGFRAWMQARGLTGADVRRMALFSPINRAQYPWLDKVVADAD